MTKLQAFLREPEIEALADDEIVVLKVGAISDFTLTLADLRESANEIERLRVRASEADRSVYVAALKSHLR